MQNKSAKNSFRLWSTVMVAISFLVGIVVYGGGRYSFGVFMKPMADSMGWSRTEISLAVTINLVCYGFSSPIIGRLLDTIGMRKVMITGATLLAVALCAMPFINTLWSLYFFFGVIAAFGSNAAGRISQATIVANWFVKRRGLMLGITAFSIGIGTAIMAPLVRMILDGYGWQLAFAFVGVLVIVLVLIPIFLFIKGHGRPEDRGFGPDGAELDCSSLSDENASPDSATLEGWTVGEAVRSSAFWAIAIGMGLTYMADYVVLLHGPAAFEDRGLTGTAAALVLSMATLASGVGRIGFGWLADRIDLKSGFCLLLGLQLVSTPLVIWGDANLIMLYGFALIWGLGYGGMSVYIPYAVTDYYGRRNFASIYGWMTMISMYGGAIGGVLAGWIYDTQHSYQLAWYLCVIAWASTMGLIYTLGGRPGKKVEGKESVM